MLTLADICVRFSGILGILRSALSSKLRTSSGMVIDDSNRELLSYVGALLVQWGMVETQVAITVQQIEMATAIQQGIWPPNYTDLSTLRSFKQRKGHLRTLISAIKNKQALRDLDEAFRLISSVDQLRHNLAHEIIIPFPMSESGPYIAVVSMGNIAKLGNMNLTYEKITKHQPKREDIPLSELKSAVENLQQSQQIILSMIGEFYKGLPL